ncbi:replicase protein [Nephila clavipes virus 4]|uniref:replicase protein n=1 Tax=Nephila clavipes virus 4 TaxID=2108201 RepID=UPI000D229785|nr:replicase protein [Nephila clavipes virus 4]AVK59480.1 replicase protein [Nephila clavipes virus 4]
MDLSKDTVVPPSELHTVCDTDFLQKKFLKEKLDSVLREERKKDTVTLKEILKPAEQQLLSSSYPEFHIVYASEINHQHAFAAASRKLELHLLLLRLRVVPGYTLKNYDDYVCDIGGEFVVHLLKGNGVHSCNPLLDIRDHQRLTTRIENLGRMVRNPKAFTFDLEKKNRILEFLDGVPSVSQKYYCNNKAQDCNRTARYGICLHSAYDISPFDFADIMLKKNMVEIYGSFIYSDLIFLHDDGTIEGINCYFSYTKDRKFIEFSFHNDPSLIYRHSTVNYLALLTLNSFKDKSGRYTFVIELLENRAGIQFFKITRINKEYEYSGLSKFLWLPSLKGKTKVKFFDLDQSAVARGDFKKALEPIEFYVDTAIIDKVVSHAYASTETKFRPVEIFNFLLAYNGRIFFGNDVCVRYNQLPHSKAMALANAIYLYVYAKKYDIGKIDQLLIAAIKHDRELAEKSILGKLWKGKFDYPSAYGSGHTRFRFLRAMSSSFHRFLYWCNRSRYDAKSFLSENMQFIRCDDKETYSQIFFKIFNKKNKKISSVIDYKFSSVIPAGRSFELKTKIAEIFSQFCVHSTDAIVCLNDLVPVVDRIKISPRNELPSSIVAKIVKNNNCAGFSVLAGGSLEGDVLVVGNSKTFSEPLEIIGNAYVMGNCNLSTNSINIAYDDLCLDCLSAISTLPINKVLLLPDNDLLIPVFNHCLRENITLYTWYSSEYTSENRDLLALYLPYYNKKFFPMKYFRREPLEFDVLAGQLRELIDDDRDFTKFVLKNGTVTPDLRKEVWIKMAKEQKFFFIDKEDLIRNPDRDTILKDLMRTKDVEDLDETLLFVCTVLSNFDFLFYYQGFHEICNYVLNLVGFNDGIAVMCYLVKKFFWIFMYGNGDNYLVLGDYFNSVVLRRNCALETCAVVTPETFGLILCHLSTWFLHRSTDFLDSIFDFFFVADPAMCFYYLACLYVDATAECVTIAEHYDALASLSLRDIREECIYFYNSDINSKLNEFLRFPQQNLVEDIPVINLELDVGIILENSVLSSSTSGFSSCLSTLDNFTNKNLDCSGSTSTLSSCLSTVGNSTDISDYVDCNDLISEFTEDNELLESESHEPVFLFENRVVIRTIPSDFVIFLKNFSDNLSSFKKTVRPGAKGKRFEYLYSPMPYTYNNVTTYPINKNIPLDFFPYVDLSFYNTLLIVVYPSGTSGLNFHKDDEPCMDSDRVLTFSVGADCTLKIKTLPNKKIFKYVLTSQYSYEFSHQRDFLHGVDTTGYRVAFTFRKRRFTEVILNPLPIDVSTLEKFDNFGLDFYTNCEYSSDVLNNFNFVGSYSIDSKENLLSEIFDSEIWLKDLKKYCLLNNNRGWEDFLRNFGTLIEVSNCGSARLLICDIPSTDDVVVMNTVIVENILKSLWVLESGGYLLLGVHLNSKLIKKLDLLGSFRVQKMFRPFSISPLSRIAYLLVGGGSGSVNNISALFNSANFHRATYHTYLQHIKQGATFNKPVLGNATVVECGGGGDCLFYSLTASDFSTACALRSLLLANKPLDINHPEYSVADVDEECAAPGIHAGTSTIIAFCEIFYSRVRIFSTVSKDLLFDYNPVKKPLYSIDLYYANNHYQRKSIKTINEKRVQNFFLDPVNLDSVYEKFLKPTFGEIPLCNHLVDLCLENVCECLEGLNSFLSLGYDDFVFFSHTNYIKDISNIFVNITNNGYKVRFLCVPGLTNVGYIFMLISKYYSRGREVNLDFCYQLYVSHSKRCSNCNNSNQIIIPPLYYHIDRIYYFCNQAELVSFTDSMEDADIVFKLEVNGLDPRDCYELIDNGDYVTVPVVLLSVNKLSDDISVLNAIRFLIDRFFSIRKSVPSMGLVNCGLDNLSFFSDVFSKYTSKIYILKEEVSVNSTGIVFNPTFLVNVDDNTYIKNSMIEAKEYYKSTISAIISKLQPTFKEYMDLFPYLKGGQSFNKRKDFGILDMGTGQFVIVPQTGGGPYSYAFDGVKLVDITTAIHQNFSLTDNLGRNTNWLKPGVFSGYMAVNSDTKLINSEKIFKQMNKFDLNKITMGFSIELIEGVPGCGKTRYIIDNHEFSLTNCNHVVLTSSKEAVEDIRSRVALKYKIDRDSFVLQKRYRTVDSFLMHFDGRTRIETLWVDEGLMRHFGDLMWCATISGCKTIKIMGDRAQVPFHNRLAGVTLQYHHLKISKSLKTTFLNTTHRCPVDVAVYLNRFGVYNRKVVSTSRIDKSVSAVLLSNISQLYAVANSTFLTFTKNERDTLRREGFSNVYTINQFQGSQAEHVVLVRDNIKPLPLFSSKNHQLVAISRHTKSFVYFTRTLEDDLYKFLLEPVTQSDIIGCSVPAKMLGGGVILGKTVTKQFPIFTIVPRAATMIDLIKQDARIRSFVQGNMGYGVVPMRINLLPIEYRANDLPFAPSYYISDAITTMQYFYDEIFPGHSVQSYEYDNKIFQQDDLFFATKEMMRMSSYERFFSSKFDSLSPSLRTSCPSAVTNDLKNVLKAFYDRNGNVPELQGLVNEEKMADCMFNNFVNCYIDNTDIFNNFSSEPIHVNVDSIEDWLFTQDRKVKDQAFPEEFIDIFTRELNVYSMILKKLPKPKLENGAEYKFPSPQTIAHSSKDINAVFCPIVREMKRRLLAVMCPNVVMFTDISVSDFEELLTVRLPAGVLRKMNFLLEADMSKYDKSQNLLALLYEIKMLRALGFPEFLIPTWIFMHVYSKLVNRMLGLVFKIFYQRKSGDPMTYFGNTLFLMAVVASINIPRFSSLIKSYNVFLLFSGDDFLAFCSVLIDLIHFSDEVAVRFNLEAKVLKYKTPYFCSKFLFMTPWGRWVVLPDVVKMLTKLGRRDLVNFQHVEEYRISCADVGRNLGNSLLYPFIDDCMRDRYKLNLDSMVSLYSAMFKCFSDSEEFGKLYYHDERHNIDDQRVFTKLNEF